MSLQSRAGFLGSSHWTANRIGRAVILRLSLRGPFAACVAMVLTVRLNWQKRWLPRGGNRLPTGPAFPGAGPQARF
jgi:hypothetical protein